MVELRPETKTPDTKSKLAVNADMAHEESLRYFLENSELGVLDKEQMGVISLIDAVHKINLDLPATAQFFESIRMLSSGEDGKARVQCKEIITAGSFPMSLLFGEQKTGIFETLKGLFSRKSDPPPQQGMR
jgi:hypothetical protein